jgi:hypothetical protein
MFDTVTTLPSASLRQALLFGINLLSLVTSNLVGASLLMLMGFNALEYSLLIAVLVTMVVCWTGVSRWFTERRVLWWLVQMGLCVVVLVGAVAISSQWWDTTNDGQTYHTDGILSLAEGWNPYRTPEPPDSIYPLWVGFFSKGPWVNAASLYRLTGTIEAGKAFQLILFVASLAIAWSVFGSQPHLPRQHAAVLSILLALNPVVVCQLLNFYVDGQLASCLTILICLMWLLDRSYDGFVLFALCMVSLLIVNLKLNGVIYLAILAGGYVLWLWVHRRPERMRVTLSLLAAGLFAVVVVGYNPFISRYLTNFLSKGDPFYPTDLHSLILVKTNTPSDLLDKDRFSRLAMSLFSQSQVSLDPTTFKIPFTVSPQEFVNFRFPDTRVGGFGPWFSGALLLSLGLGLATLWQARHTLKRLSFPVLLLILIAISIISSDQGWWPRYAPQLWVIPIIIVALVLSTAVSQWLSRGAVLVILVLFINAAIITTIYLALGIADQQTVRQDLAALHAQSLIEPLEVNFNTVPMVQWRFDREGIAYQVVEDLPRCPEGYQHRNVVFSISIVCGPE